MFAKGEFVDAMLRFPFSETAPKITSRRRRCLVAFLSRLGEQLHVDCRNRARNTVHPSRRVVSAVLPYDIAPTPSDLTR